MANEQIPVPPMEILTEFLCALGGAVSKDDGVVLIVRGSFLLKHWFGDDARPAADIDLECFERMPFAKYQRFGAAMNYAKTLCMYAAESSRYHQPNQDMPPIEFTEVNVPDDGTSLWEYGTPGERCYTGWVWNARGGASGLLQIDIAQAGSYDLDYVSVANIELVDSNSAHFHVQAYTPEMLLAAKLSWILRGLKWQDGASALKWSGAPKDLFDAHLLVTKGDLRIDEFERAMLAVAAEDKLDWKALDAFANLPRTSMTDTDFPNWDGFQHAYPEQVRCGPAEMLRVVAERLTPLLAELRRHAPFLLAIQAEPVDEVPYLIYADWLQERSGPRGDFLRLFIRWYFHEDRPDTLKDFVRVIVKRLFGNDEASAKELTDIREALKLALQKMSTPWLYHLFGSAERFRAIKQRIEA